MVFDKGEMRRDASGTRATGADGDDAQPCATSETEATS
jgi:hypothetical protein